MVVGVDEEKGELVVGIIGWCIRMHTISGLTAVSQISFGPIPGIRSAEELAHKSGGADAVSFAG